MVYINRARCEFEFLISELRKLYNDIYSYETKNYIPLISKRNIINEIKDDNTKIKTIEDLILKKKYIDFIHICCCIYERINALWFLLFNPDKKQNHIDRSDTIKTILEKLNLTQNNTSVYKELIRKFYKFVKSKIFFAIINLQIENAAKHNFIYDTKIIYLDDLFGLKYPALIASENIYLAANNYSNSLQTIEIFNLKNVINDAINIIGELYNTISKRTNLGKINLHDKIYLPTKINVYTLKKSPSNEYELVSCQCDLTYNWEQNGKTTIKNANDENDENIIDDMNFELEKDGIITIQIQNIDDFVFANMDDKFIATTHIYDLIECRLITEKDKYILFSHTINNYKILEQNRPSLCDEYNTILIKILLKKSNEYLNIYREKSNKKYKKYKMLLHTISSLSDTIFTKELGLSLNIDNFIVYLLNKELGNAIEAKEIIKFYEELIKTHKNIVIKSILSCAAKNKEDSKYICELAIFTKNISLKTDEYNAAAQTVHDCQSDKPFYINLFKINDI